MIRASETYDSLTSLWRYDYTVVNESSADQDIRIVELKLGAGVASVELPAGWDYFTRSVDSFNPESPGINSTLFKAMLPSEPLTMNFWPPSEYQIPPGDSLSGFGQVSPYPPGYSRTFVQGHSGALFPPDPSQDPDAYYVMNPVPHDTTNSQRGWTLGPMIYDRVLTPGDEGNVSDGFLAFMNIGAVATVLIDPAPIALKFGIYGETVFPETFQATLNGVDVTSAFLPGPPDGADRVGVFRLGNSPLVEGVNTLETSIEGIELWTQQRMTDLDVVKFITPTESECTPQLSQLCR